MPIKNFDGATPAAIPIVGPPGGPGSPGTPGAPGDRGPRGNPGPGGVVQSVNGKSATAVVVQAGDIPFVPATPTPQMRDLPTRIQDLGSVPTDKATFYAGLSDNRAGLQSALSEAHQNVPSGTYSFSAGTIGTPGKTLRLLPGARFTGASGNGSLSFSAGSRIEAHHEGADGDVRYWGHRPTGTRPIGTGALDAGFSPASWMFDVRTDDSDCGGTFGVGVMARHIITGGANTRGGREAIYGVMFRQGATANNNANENYVAIQSAIYATAGDGGYPNTNPSINGGQNVYRGADFASGNAAYATKNVTYTLNLSGSEDNLFVEPFDGTVGGPSIRFITGRQIIGCHATRGIDIDAGLTFSGQDAVSTYGPEVGFNHIVLISDYAGKPPVHAGSTLLAAKWFNTANFNFPITHGIDLVSFNVSGSLIRGKRSALTEGSLFVGDAIFSGVSVVSANSPTGNSSLRLQGQGTGGVQFLTAQIPQATSDAAAASAGVPVGGIYRNSNALQIRVN